MFSTPRILIEPPKEFPYLENIKGEAKLFVDDFLLNLNMKNMFCHMGVSPDKTFLLYGPPGTGKTFATNVINNEANKKVNLEEKLVIDNLDLITMKYDIGTYGTAYLNQGSRNIQAFFNRAHKYAQKDKNVFLVFDEADVLFESRTTTRQRHSEDSKNLETLMKNFQEVHDVENIYIIMITNFDKALDHAAIRSGRIDKKIKFLLPNEEERTKAFDYEINKINSKADYKVIRSYNTEELSKLTDTLNYADINNIVESAIKIRVKEVDKNSKGIVVPYITQKYLLKSLKKVKPKEKDLYIY